MRLQNDDEDPKDPWEEEEHLLLVQMAELEIDDDRRHRHYIIFRCACASQRAMRRTGAMRRTTQLPSFDKKRAAP